jgi:putative transposase
MTVRPAMLRLGDDVELRGVIYRHTALDGDVAMLAVAGEAPVAIKVGSLLADETFRIVGTRPTRRRITGPSMLFDSLPADVQEKARWMEDHMTEVLDGVPCNADTGQTAKRTFDVARTSLRQREQAKLAELHELGETMSIGSLQRLRHAYEKKGVLGLVDRRLIRQTPLAGRTDQRVVDAILSVLEANTHQSSGTTDRLMRQVGKQLEAAYGPVIVTLPSRATFHRLIGKLAEGRHATGSARTRRTLAQQPEGPFGAVYPVRPGELMQIDSTPLDIAVELDDGVIGRVELTAMVDIATRSIPAAVVRPATKAVDAALLLARCLTPELMRPGWAQAASMAASALPYRSMKSIDERLEGAAAKPVIVPETIVCDHGKAYLSNTFKSACSSPPPWTSTTPWQATTPGKRTAKPWPPRPSTPPSSHSPLSSPHRIGWRTPARPVPTFSSNGSAAKSPTDSNHRAPSTPYDTGWKPTGHPDSADPTRFSRANPND